MCKKLHFFWTFFPKSDENRRNSHFFSKNMGKYGRYRGKYFCTKIDIFLRKSKNFLYFELFSPILWDIRRLSRAMSRLFLICTEKWIVQKIDIFFKFPIHLYWKWAQNWEIYGPSAVCKKLTFFSEKVHFTPIFSHFCLFYGKIVAEPSLHKNCKKLTFFSKNRSK